MKVFNLLHDDGVPYLKREKTIKFEEKLNTPDAIAEFLCKKPFEIHKQAEECVYILSYDSACRCTGAFLLSRGTVNCALMTPREVFIRLLLAGAVGFVMVHNHPSGSNKFSDEDIKLAKQLRTCGKFMNVTCHDFMVIAGKDKWCSAHVDGLFKKEGTIEP